MVRKATRVRRRVRRRVVVEASMLVVGQKGGRRRVWIVGGRKLRLKDPFLGAFGG